MNEQQKKTLVFIGLILLIVIILFAVFVYLQKIVEALPWLLLLVFFFVFIVLGKPLLMLKEYERAVIFRFGRANRVGGPGWALVIPGIESYRVVDLRTKTIDVEKQDVVTKDLIELKIDAVLYLRVGKSNDSVIKSVVEVEDYAFAAKTLVVSSIRDLIGSMTLAEVIANVEELNVALKKKLEVIATKWGIEVEAVEMKDVDLPRVVLEAMHAEKAAVQEKLARLQKAEAQKVEIEAVQQAAEKLSDKALAYYYIKALEEMSKGKGTKIVFPMEFSRLAESLTGKMFGGEKVSTSNVNEYKKILEEAIENAVKQVKSKEKTKIIK